MINTNKENQRGSVIISALILVLVIGIVVAYGYSDRLISYTQYTSAAMKSREVFILADSCMEEVLLKIQRVPTYTTTSITLPSGTCSVAISAAGDNRTVTIDASIDTFHKKIEATVTVYYYEIKLLSWREIQ